MTGDDPIEPDPAWACDMGEIPRGYLHPEIDRYDPLRPPADTTGAP